ENPPPPPAAVVVQPPPPPPPAVRHRPWAWITAGAAVALAAGGTVVGLRARSSYDDYTHDPIAPSFSDVPNQAPAAHVLFASAGAAAVGSALLFVFEDAPPKTDRAVALVPCGVLGVGLAARF